jgi:hypothetical protein
MPKALVASRLWSDQSDVARYGALAHPLLFVRVSFPRFSSSITAMRPLRLIVVLGCHMLAGCAALEPPHAVNPIATWVGPRPVGAAVECVKGAMDEAFGGPRRFLPGIAHATKVIEEGRVYEIGPVIALGSGVLHFARVRSDGPNRTVLQLFINPEKYEAPLRDALAKCVQ